MSTKENNPRTIRTALEEMVAEFQEGKIERALFTTFNFSTPFFENNVLPLLFGFPVEDLKGRDSLKKMVNENLGYAADGEANKTHVVVVCDKSVRMESKGKYKYGVLSIGLPNGRFHPKIILLQGTTKDGSNRMCISVGSANLSYSGWASNREVIGWTRVYDNHKEELYRFLDWLKERAEHIFHDTGTSEAREEGDIRHFFSSFSKTVETLSNKGDKDTPSLHIAIPGQSPQSIMARMQGKGQQWESVTVFSPYWGNVGELVDQFHAKENNIVLTPDFKGKYSINIQTVPAGYRFYISSEANSFTHAKVYILKNSSVSAINIGSANCTSAALLGAADNEGIANVEAVLFYRIKNNDVKNISGRLKLISRQEVEKNCSDTDEPEEGAPALPPFEVEVLYDWKTLRVHYSFKRIIADLEDCELVLGEHKEQLSKEKGHFELRPKKMYRSFYVKYRLKGQENEFIGMIYQLNADDYELQYHTRPRTSDVLDAFRNLDLGISKEKRKKIERKLNPDGKGGGDGTEDPEEDDEERFDYFSLFQGIYRFKKFAFAKENKAVDYINSRTGISLLRLFDSIIGDDVEDKGNRESPAKTIWRYLILSEIKALIGSSQTKCSWEKNLGAAFAEARQKLLPILKDQNIGSMLPWLADVKRETNETFLQWFEKESAFAWE